MRTWLIAQWTDEAKFIGTLRSLLVILAGLFSMDIIPTGIPGLGPKVAVVLTAIAVKMNAGDKTPHEVGDAIKDGRL